MKIVGSQESNEAKSESLCAKGFGKTAISVLTRNCLAAYLPPRVKLGIPSLAPHLEYWEPTTDYVVAGRCATGASALTLTLAENFVASGGHVIWVGTTDNFARICEQLMFKIAGVDLTCDGGSVKHTTLALFKLKYARHQVRNMWADFCNVEECGDAFLEASFIASVSSFKPTLILVEQSIFDATTRYPLQMPVRHAHALRMVDELRQTNPLSSVVWHLPLPPAGGSFELRPSLNDLPEVAAAINPKVVLLTHRNDESGSKHNAEVIIAANAYGSTGTVSMILDSMRLTWHEFDDMA